MSLSSSQQGTVSPELIKLPGDQVTMGCAGIL